MAIRSAVMDYLREKVVLMSSPQKVRPQTLPPPPPDSRKISNLKISQPTNLQVNSTPKHQFNLQQYATMPSRPRSTPPTKRRKILMGKQPAEILFDTAAREDYLTGFHKRKLQRIKQAQELAKEAAKEEKKVHRREVRTILSL